MKLANVLSIVNQVEKSKFINAIDRICSDAVKHDKKITAQLNKLEGQIKDASSTDITQLFKIALPYFEKTVRDQLDLLGAQATLLTNILSRDGNSIARISWVEALYSKEWEAINLRATELKSVIEATESNDYFSDGKRLSIYYACYQEAFSNDERVNREAKISNDERCILNVLAKQLDVTADDQAGVEHLIELIPMNGVQESLNELRELGLIFISRKRQTVYVPDEIVNLLHRLQGKELADKHQMRILRTFSDSELSIVLKNHRKKIRGVDRKEKISNIMKLGISTSQLLQTDLYNADTALNDKKERLKILINDLDLSLDKLGTTLEERIALIVISFTTCAEKEFNSLSATGFKELYSALQNHFPKL
ncbi:hypothetical protein [Alteromonas ponticola]|uniref:hypothetical protein n=1 Tax=Alteromonas ponticola TaxID=2720613 RepID=UPI001FE4BBBD|nr:hypothetical protein [Alteromonas ponticola]